MWCSPRNAEPGLRSRRNHRSAQIYLNDIFTVTVNIAGLPGISVPAGLSADGWPLELQLIGKPFHEETLFQTASAIEGAAGRYTPKQWW